MFHGRIAVAALLVLGAAGTAGAQSLMPWGASDYWDVMIDPTLGNGCLIQSAFEDGSVVRIGLDATKGTGYVTAFNEAWGDIEEGKLYPIRFDLDGEAFEGEARGMYLDGVPGADVVFDNVDFFMSIAERQTMTMYHDGAEVMAIDLTGTMAGLAAVLECQDEQG
ncbi:hypothetical protein [Paragemmobacter ruber]|uniref:Uncharacterized protein n=1 Tax=Paragemmobacter ruber TaxID=1985673 RepID=A0ABW9Y6H8_9RHOB|nr:hypothetical protein [Rhodobacter ruber]NBE07459.1 hypothetical protein [Rhodobacter ruber]